MCCTTQSTPRQRSSCPATANQNGATERCWGCAMRRAHGSRTAVPGSSQCPGDALQTPSARPLEPLDQPHGQRTADAAGTFAQCPGRSPLWRVATDTATRLHVSDARVTTAPRSSSPAPGIAAYLQRQSGALIPPWRTVAAHRPVRRQRGRSGTIIHEHVSECVCVEVLAMMRWASHHPLRTASLH